MRSRFCLKACHTALFFLTYTNVCVMFLDKEKCANSRISSQKDDEVQPQSLGTEKISIRSIFTGNEPHAQSKCRVLIAEIIVQD